MSNDNDDFFKRIKSGNINLGDKDDRYMLKQHFSNNEIEDRVTLDKMQCSGTWNTSNYKSFLKYCLAVFPEAGSRSKVSRSLNAASIEKVLGKRVGGLKESILRPMYPLLSNKEFACFITTVWDRACEISPKKSPRKCDVSQAINEIREKDKSFPDIRPKKRNGKKREMPKQKDDKKRVPVGTKNPKSPDARIGAKIGIGDYREYAKKLPTKELKKAIKVFKTVLKERKSVSKK